MLVKIIISEISFKAIEYHIICGVPQGTSRYIIYVYDIEVSLRNSNV